MATLGVLVAGWTQSAWVLVLGIFVYMAAAALAFPYEGIFLHRVLGVSMTVVGVLFGLVPLLVMPFSEILKKLLGALT